MNKMKITGTRQYKKLSIRNNLVWFEDLKTAILHLTVSVSF